MQMHLGYHDVQEEVHLRQQSSLGDEYPSFDLASPELAEEASDPVKSDVLLPFVFQGR